MASKFEIFIDVFIGIFLIAGLLAPFSSDIGNNLEEITGSIAGNIFGRPACQPEYQCANTKKECHIEKQCAKKYVCHTEGGKEVCEWANDCSITYDKEVCKTVCTGKKDCECSKGCQNAGANCKDNANICIQGTTTTTVPVCTCERTATGTRRCSLVCPMAGRTCDNANVCKLDPAQVCGCVNSKCSSACKYPGKYCGSEAPCLPKLGTTTTTAPGSTTTKPTTTTTRPTTTSSSTTSSSTTTTTFYCYSWAYGACGTGGCLPTLRYRVCTNPYGYTECVKDPICPSTTTPVTSSGSKCRAAGGICTSSCPSGKILGKMDCYIVCCKL